MSKELYTHTSYPKPFNCLSTVFKVVVNVR